VGCGDAGEGAGGRAEPLMRRTVAALNETMASIEAITGLPIPQVPWAGAGAPPQEVAPAVQQER